MTTVWFGLQLASIRLIVKSFFYLYAQWILLHCQSRIKCLNLTTKTTETTDEKNDINLLVGKSCSIKVSKTGYSKNNNSLMDVTSTCHRYQSVHRYFYRIYYFLWSIDFKCVILVLLHFQYAYWWNSATLSRTIYFAWKRCNFRLLNTSTFNYE